MRTERTDQGIGEINATDGDKPAATDLIEHNKGQEDDAMGSAKPMDGSGDDIAGKRGRQMNARLVRMHGGLVIEGSR